MKKSTFGILATVAIAFSPLAAFAEDAQTNIQSNTNSAAAVGDANAVIQKANQNSRQTQVDIEGYLNSTPSAQTSVQDNANEAATIGSGNGVVQDAKQNSAQTSVDIESYIPSYLGH